MSHSYWVLANAFCCHKYEHIYTCMYIPIHIHSCMYLRTCMSCIYTIHVCTHMLICAQTHVYICIKCSISLNVNICVSVSCFCLYRSHKEEYFRASEMLRRSLTTDCDKEDSVS